MWLLSFLSTAQHSTCLPLGVWLFFSFCSLMFISPSVVFNFLSSACLKVRVKMATLQLSPCPVRLTQEWAAMSSAFSLLFIKDSSYYYDLRCRIMLCYMAVRCANILMLCVVNVFILGVTALPYMDFFTYTSSCSDRQ